jgi:dTDP-4-amino-4,6-dideoxygalactose transaminase
VKVPFQDLGRLHASIAAELDEAVSRVLETSAFVGGSEVADFEQAFAAAHGQRFAIGCGSGTDALALALRAAGIGPGDEVVVPAMTFVATAEAVVHCGATPVIVDVDPDTLLLDPEHVEQRRSSRTRAVMPVHLYGQVVPFEHLAAWRRDGLVVIEDAAQAHLATFDGEFVGARSDAACFSFYPGKNLGALGDGGMVITGDEALARRVRSLRDHGRHGKYVHDEIGWCSRLDGLQAAVLGVKLRQLARWTDARRQIAQAYATSLAGIDDLRLVPWTAGAVHHLLVVRVPPDSREAIQMALAEAGVASGIHYPVPLSKQPSLEPWAVPCPAAEGAATSVLSLPMDPLMTTDDVDYVAGVFEAALGGGRTRTGPR